MLPWMTTTTLGRMVTTFLISMVPIIELRAGLPYGIALGLPYPLALLSAILGNMLPVPFIIVYIRGVFAWMRKRSPRWDEMIGRLEKKAHLKGRLVRKYSAVGLCALVAIPLPGTGAWTGALVAAMLDIRLRRAVPIILTGLCIAAAIMSVMTYGVAYLIA